MGCLKLDISKNYEPLLRVVGKNLTTKKGVVNYYPGGSIMPGRSFAANSYRYGFNKGSEKDDEITGVTGSHFTTKFREGDTRLLRWWSVDPKADLQPWQSPYNYMDGNPITKNDPDGDCPWCAVIGGAIEYGTQVYSNYQEEGVSAYDAWIGKVDFVDVAIEAGTNLIPGGKLIKGAVLVGGEFLKSSVDVTGNGEVNYVGDGTGKKEVGSVVKEAAINTVISVGGNQVSKKIGSISSDKALKAASSAKKAAYKNLHKANNVVKYGNDRTKVNLPTKGWENVNAADQKLQFTKTLNKGGLGTDAGKKVVEEGVKSGAKTLTEE